MKVYIIFGDTPRSDGDNIEGIYATKELAIQQKIQLEKEWGKYCDYRIEEFEEDE